MCQKWTGGKKSDPLVKYIKTIHLVLASGLISGLDKLNYYGGSVAVQCKPLRRGELKRCISRLN